MAKLNITQVRSRIGSTELQKKNLDALGLRKMHRTVTHEDSPVIRGMIEKVLHLVVVEAAKEEKAPKAAAPKAEEAKAEKAEVKSDKPAAAKTAKADKPAAPKAAKPKAAAVKEVKPETTKEDESK